MEQITSYKQLKTQKQYLKLLCANIINRFGDSVDAIAFAWLMYDITKSASLMALILGLNYIPTVLFQPISGAIVDRISKKNVMVWMDIGRGIIVGATVVLFLTGGLNPLTLTAMTLLNSTLEAFRVPAGSAIVPLILEKEYFTVGQTANSTASRITELVGLAAAGGIVALIDISGALLIDAATFFISAFIIFFIKVDEKRKEKQKGEKVIDVKQISTDFKEGLSFTYKEKMMLLLFLIGSMINFCITPLNTFAVPYVSDSLKMGPEMLSIIQILLVLGMGLGSVITPKMTGFFGGKKPLIVSGIFSGTTMIALWWVPFISNKVFKIGLLFIILAVLGVAIGIISVTFSSAFMKFVPADMMGRMSGLSNAIFVVSIPVASFICSALAAFMSITSVILVFGVLMLVLYCTISFSKLLNRL